MERVSERRYLIEGGWVGASLKTADYRGTICRSQRTDITEKGGKHNRAHELSMHGKEAGNRMNGENAGGVT